MLKKIVLINVLLENFSKINKRPGPNKDVLGGKLSKNNKNVLDYYSEDQSNASLILIESSQNSVSSINTPFSFR